MKILLDAFVLAAGGVEQPEDVRINGRRVVQVANYLRALYATPFPRGNRINTVTFAVTRDHASYAAAQWYLSVHAATLPAAGTLKLMSELWEGGAAQYLGASAVIESDDGSQDGICTRHQYSLVCGPLSGPNIPIAAPR